MTGMREVRMELAVGSALGRGQVGQYSEKEDQSEDHEQANNGCLEGLAKGPLTVVVEHYEKFMS